MFSMVGDYNPLFHPTGPLRLYVVLLSPGKRFHFMNKLHLHYLTISFQFKENRNTFISKWGNSAGIKIIIGDRFRVKSREKCW
jgi:hypothetical protein